MPLTTTTIVATTTVGSALATKHAHSKARSVFQNHAVDQIVPINSTLHETSVMRSFAKGLHRYDADYLVASLQMLSTALQTHHGFTHVPADVLLDAFIPMIRRHCRLVALAYTNRGHCEQWTVYRWVGASLRVLHRRQCRALSDERSDHARHGVVATWNPFVLK